MAENDDYDEQEESPGKGLRAQLEQALREKKELESQVADLAGKYRQVEVTSILAAKGVNSKIAKFIPSDVTGEEAISKWLEENADVFGGFQQSQEQAPHPKSRTSPPR